MRRTLAGLGLIGLGAGAGTLIGTPALAAPGDVVISQVYGGAGSAAAAYRQDYVELYNRSKVPVSLDGWSVQYASAVGISWRVTALSGTLEPGRHYLVAEAAGVGGAE